MRAPNAAISDLSSAISDLISRISAKIDASLLSMAPIPAEQTRKKDQRTMPGTRVKSSPRKSIDTIPRHPVKLRMRPLFSRRLRVVACALLSTSRRPMLTLPSSCSRRLSAPPSSTALILEQERRISELQGALREAISSGKWETAEALAKECLEATEAHFSKEHTVYAAALNNCGLVYKSRGKEEEALGYYQQAFKLYSRLVGQDHTSTAAALCNLGLCNVALATRASGMRKLDLVETAKRCLVDAVEIRARVLGRDHWQTSSASVHLASALRVGRQFGEAERTLVAAISALRHSVGDRHAATAAALNNLGLLYKQMGELDRARDAYTEAWALRKALHGERHADTIATHYNLAELARAGGDEVRAAAIQADILRLLGAAPQRGEESGQDSEPRRS
jgi:tetratricopeptide (TPR) repeat protein